MTIFAFVMAYVENKKLGDSLSLFVSISWSNLRDVYSKYQQNKTYTNNNKTIEVIK